jgi:hypothetical protein
MVESGSCRASDAFLSRTLCDDWGILFVDEDLGRQRGAGCHLWVESVLALPKQQRARSSREAVNGIVADALKLVRGSKSSWGQLEKDQSRTTVARNTVL